MALYVPGVARPDARIFTTMHFPIAILLFALSGNDLVAAAPSPLDTGSLVSGTPSSQQPPILPSEAADDDRRGLRADPSTQLLYSTIGGGLGIVGGGFLGGAVGAGLSAESDGWAAIGNVIFGVGLGALAGGTTGATWGAVLARPKQKSRSIVPTALGGLGGLALGFAGGAAAYSLMGNPENTAAISLCFLAIPALGAGTGATMIDQSTAPRRISEVQRPSSLALVPWFPRGDLVGLRLSLPTGI